MSGIFVYMAQPADGATVRRNITIEGSFSRFNGSIYGAQIQFGAGGPTVNLNGGWGFSWSGNIPNDVRPGQSFQIIVSAWGYMRGKDIVPGEPGDPIPVDGQAVHTVTLEYVVPTLTVAPFQSHHVATQVPYVLTLAGNASEGGGYPYGITQLLYQVGSGPPTNIATNANGDFSVGLSLQ